MEKLKVQTQGRGPRKLCKEERELVEKTLSIAAWIAEKRGGTHIPIDRIDSPLMVTQVIGVMQKADHAVDPQYNPKSEAVARA